MTFGLSIIPLIALIMTAVLAVFVWKIEMHFPLIIGMMAASIVALIAGFKWEEIQEMMIKGVTIALPAVFILFIIGTIVGSWIASGVIPTIIYYGLAIIKPEIFVPIVALVTGIVSITLGSSFTSIATVGLAFMAIGQGLGFPPGLVGGAIISGAFFGDKLSPISDTTNIAAAVAETDLFSHIMHMLWDTIPAFLMSLILYWLFSNTGETIEHADVYAIKEISVGLKSTFIIHPILLFVPIITIVLMVLRIPAIPALMGVSLLGAFLAVTVQGYSIGETIAFMMNGYVGETGIARVDALLSRGGLMSMLSTISFLILATALGGILERTGSFEVLTHKIMEKVKTTGALIGSTILSTFLVGFASGEQFLTIILPARTFVNKYKDMGIDTKNLSRCVEAAGTVGINLVPWGVTAVFAASVLGISPMEFIPFAFFVMLVPFINIVFGFTGWTIHKKQY